MSRPLQILALVGDAWGGRGGIAQYNRDLLGAWAEAPFVCGITVLPREAPDAVEPPRGVRQLAPRRGRVGYSLAVLTEAVCRPVDMVFCGHLFMAPLARLVARIKGARLIVQTHGIEAWPTPKPAQRAALEDADLVLAVSRYTRARIQAWAALPPERLIVLPNTFGKAFTPGDGEALRKAWGLEGRKVLLTVGRMDSREGYKGHDRVIAALPKLAVKVPGVAYVVVGEGDDQPRLEALAREAGVADCVHFRGLLPESAKLDAYRMADLFVMPSTGEGFGIVFVEAMACGTPALGLGEAGAMDALADGELGIIASEHSLVVALQEILQGAGAGRTSLAKRTRDRFGRAKFEVAARAVVERLQDQSGVPEGIPYCAS